MIHYTWCWSHDPLLMPMHAKCYVAVIFPQLFATLLSSMNNSNFIGY